MIERVFEDGPQILDSYRKSRAFRIVQKRQSHVMKQLTRIKDSFQKKRQQILMLAVDYSKSEKKTIQSPHQTKPNAPSTPLEPNQDKILNYE